MVLAPSTSTRSPFPPRARPAALAATSLIFAALAGCGSDGTAAARWDGSVDTLASGVVHVQNPATGVWGEEERVRLVEDLRIGSIEGTGPQSFGQVRSVEVDPLGRIWVLEGQAAEVRVFDAGGRHVRTIGGQGQGPGELQFPTGLLWSPEALLWVHDLQNRRYEIFDTAGARVGSVPLEGGGFGFGGGTFGADGHLHEMVPVRDQDGMRQVLVRYRVEDATRTSVDTAQPPVLARPETVEMRTQSDGRTMVFMMPIPLQNSPSRRIDRHGYFWANHGGDGYRLLRETFDGDTLRIVDREHEPVPVTEAELDEVLEGYPEGAEARIDRSRIPRVRPPFETFFPADDGSLWVRRYAAPGRQVWDWFDREGRYLGEIGMDIDPARFTPHRIMTDAVYGVVRDELDVPWVVRLRMERDGVTSGR